MANSVIGALRVNLGLDSAKFQSGIKQAKTSMQKFGSFVKTGLLAAAAAAAAAFAAVSAAVKSTISDMDNLAKTSKQVGVAVEELSQLRFAAELAGVSFEQLSNGLGKFAKSMSDAVRTATSEQALAFKALNISVRDSRGALRSSVEVMKEVADRFSKMEDSAGKTALAMSIFGRAGRQMIPLLNEGAAGINKLMKEADELGLTISTKTAKAAEEFNDTLTRIKSVFNGIINRLTAALLPALQSVATWMLNASKNTEVFRVAGEALGATIRVIATGVTLLVAQFKALVIWIGAVGEAARNMFSGEFGKAYESLEVAVEGTKNLISNSISQIKTIWTDQANEIESEAPSLSAKLAAPVLQTEKKVKTSKKKIKKELTDMQKFMRDLGSVFQSFGVGIFDDLIAGTFKLKDALKSLLSDLGNLLANNFMRMLLSNLMGGAGSAGGMLSGLLGAFPGFATGGSFKVGGAGGIDSQLVAFRASPDETVDVMKPGQQSKGSDVNVTVINQSKSAVVEDGGSGRDADGNPFHRMYVRDAIHEAIPSGLKKQKGLGIKPELVRR